MKTWNIAKILIQSCSSPEEVSGILATLRDPKEVESVCVLLSSFSAVTPPLSPWKSAKVVATSLPKTDHLPSEPRRLQRKSARRLVVPQKNQLQIS